MIFYYSYLPGQDKSDNVRVVMEMYVRRQVSEASKEAIKAIADTLSKRKRTDEGIKRWDRIIEKLFPTKTYTSNIKFLSRCVSHNEIFCSTLTKKDPQIHRLHVEQLRFVKSFLCFLRPEKIPKSGEKLMKLNVTLRSMQLEDRQLFLVAKSRKKLKGCKKKDEWAINFLKAARCAYELGSKNILSKMPLANTLLRALSALDPSIRVHTLTLDELLKLPELVANVLIDEELDEFDMQVRKYITANDLPPYDPKTCRIDEWWGKMDDKNEFTILKKNGLCPFILFS